MFLDPELPALEVPSGVDMFLEEHVLIYNMYVLIGLPIALTVSAVLHYWAFRQDAVDHAKPLVMKDLGDGISKPRSQDDPVRAAPINKCKARFS